MFYTCLSVILFKGAVHAGIYPLSRPPLPSACWDTPTPAQFMLGHTQPRPVHAGINMATAADGTHPTEMHSCLHVLFTNLPDHSVKCVYLRIAIMRCVL